MKKNFPFSKSWCCHALRLASPGLHVDLLLLPRSGKTSAELIITRLENILVALSCYVSKATNTLQSALKCLLTSLLSNMQISGCNYLFPSSPSQPIIGIWKCFGQLQFLKICRCDSLIYWPEEEFMSLVSLKFLLIS